MRAWCKVSAREMSPSAGEGEKSTGLAPELGAGGDVRCKLEMMENGS